MPNRPTHHYNKHRDVSLVWIVHQNLRRQVIRIETQMLLKKLVLQLASLDRGHNVHINNNYIISPFWMTFCTAFSEEDISDIALEQWFLNLVLGTTLCVFLFFVCLPYLTHLIQIISSLGETPWTELSVSDNRHTKCAGPELTTALEFSQTIYLSRKHYIAFFLSATTSSSFELCHLFLHLFPKLLTGLC